MQQISNLEGLGDIRAKLNSTRIYQQFETVADLIASSRPVPEGEYVGVPRLGHWYIGAASGASDHHLTNAFGSKLYVLPESVGVYHFGAWGPDTSGSTDIETKLEAAFAATIAAGDHVTLKMPGGEFLFNPSTSSFVLLGRGQTFNWIGNGATVFNMANAGGVSIRPDGQYFLSTDLSAAVEAGADMITLDDVTDVQIGDLIRIDSTVAIETGWGYGKEELRVINDIDGNNVWLHHPLYWPHDPADSGHAVYVAWPSYAHVKDIHFQTNARSGAGGPALGFAFMSGGSITGGSTRGTAIGWTSGAFADGPSISRCIGIDIQMDMERLRYAPKFLGSFGCRWHDSTARGIRHADMNEWSQHIIIENINSSFSQGVIQSHPNIGGIFRNVRDGVRSESTYTGFDLRGLGELVENCSVITKAPAGIQNTNEPLIKSEFAPYCVNHRRIVRNFYGPKATVSAGRDGETLFENVTAYQILTARLQDYTLVRASPNCVALRDADTNFDTDSKLNTLQASGPITVPLVRRFKTDGSVQTITGITQANPAVVTISSHGYTDGDFVYVWGGTMTEIENYFTVTAATTDTFQLTTLEGDLVDSTAYTAYTANGKATKKAEVDGIDPNVYPAVGQAGKMHMIAKLAADQASTFTKEFLYRPYTESTAPGEGRNAILTFRAGTRDEWSERKVAVNFRANSTITSQTLSQTDTDNTILTIGDPTITNHISNIATEGAANYASNDLARYYILFSVQVTCTQNCEWFTVEIEDWHQSLMSTSLIR